MNRSEILNKVRSGIGYLSIKDFATLSGWSESTVRRFEKQAKIPKRTTISRRIKGWPVKEVIAIIENIGSE